MGQMLLFVGVASVGVGLIHYYLWRKLVRNTLRGRRARRLGATITVALSMLVVAAVVGGRVLPHRASVIVSWPGYIWIALMFYLLVTLALLEIPSLVGRLWIRRQTAPDERANTAATRPELASLKSASLGPASFGPASFGPASFGPAGFGPAGFGPAGPAGQGGMRSPAGSAIDEGRRLLLARSVAITAGLAATGIVGSGVRSAMGPPLLKQVQIPIAKLSRSADGLRIALVADIHLGPLRGYSHTRRIVDMINGLDADVVAVVGDLVDGSVAELGPAAAPLRDLRSRYGSYFVTGNHEYYSGYQQWVDEVARLGVRPLRNARVEIPGGLDLAGVNDISGGAYGDAADVTAALAGRDPARPVVLLAHQPLQAKEAAKHGVDLQLSGHTHGGQMVPFNLIVKLAQQPVVSGLGHVDGMPVYVTNGAGFWGPPVRVGAPPDITLVRLRAT